jgi:hypothetical protein
MRLTASHMQLFETSTESFIVKIWTDKESNFETWFGQITHVLSGEKRTFYSLPEIDQFMLPYLQQIGLDQDSNWFK